jgi:phosphoribosylamine--glycine ligase
MNILLIGGGGREHAIAWKLAQSKLCTQVFIAPGNPGTAEIGTNIDISVNDFETQKTFCLENKIEMVIVGPEDPLVNGIYDFFQQDALNHIHIIGPSQHGAQLEGSKAFAKEFMLKMNIPTAKYKEFSAVGCRMSENGNISNLKPDNQQPTTDNYEAGIEYIKNHPLPIVLKADGLAAGKGVVIAETHEEALQAFKEMLQENKFGKAGAKVVIEEFLRGIECSVFVLTDGENYCLLPTAKDYKRIGEGDKGLNTGGMGAISPVPFADDIFMQKVISRIVEPTVKGLQQEKIIYKGFVFIGLIKVNDEPFVIEYNCRMGDPETEVVMPRLESDLVELLLKLKNNELAGAECKLSPKHAATIMLVSGGYPEDFEKGKIMTGFENCENSLLFHAATKQVGNNMITNGGRVLAITTLADDLQTALKTSNSNAEKIQYEGKYYRKDIGWEFS